MSKSVLVTGGAGFIGSYIADALIAGGHKVRVLDNLEQQVHGKKKPDYLNKKAEYVFGDIRDEGVLRKSVEDIEVIFHEAAAVGVGQSMYNIKKYVDANTMGTAKLLDMLVNEENDVKKIIVASSMSVYGEGKYECSKCGIIYPRLRDKKQLKSKQWEMRCPSCSKDARPLPTNEEKPLAPTSIYAITKRDQEEMCLTIGMAYGIPTVALRYFNVYGPRQALSNPYTGVCAIFSSRIKNNNPPVIFEDGLQGRDFVSVHDIANANILALEKSRADYGVFNVGTGRKISIGEIADILIKLYKKNIKPQIPGTYREGDIRHCYADISKISKLGFEPKIEFETGIKELVGWVDSQDASNISDKFETANEELRARKLA